MRNFMKNLALVMVTAFVTATLTIGYMGYKFGMVNVSSHTDRYVTTCNGEVVNQWDQNVTDEVYYDVKVNERFNIFSR